MLALKSQLRNNLRGARRLVILGIGSSLRGDDASGLIIVREINKALRRAKRAFPLRVISCGTTPENYTGEIKKFKPTHIIIIDALDSGKEAGKISIADARKKSVNASFSTHSLPIKVFADYLTSALGCHIVLIGIQPGSIEFGSALSSAVNKAIKKVSSLIIKHIVS